MPMYQNAAILVLVTLVTKAAGYATLPKAGLGGRSEMAPIDVSVESAGALVVPDTCPTTTSGCACAFSNDPPGTGTDRAGTAFGKCALLGSTAVPLESVDNDVIEYCFNTCFSDGDLYPRTDGVSGPAPCYQGSQTGSFCHNVALIWQKQACTAIDKGGYAMDNMAGSIFQADPDLCAGGAVSGDFCTVYDPDLRTEVTSGSCQESMERVRTDGWPGNNRDGLVCSEPFSAECSEAACESLIGFTTNAMNGGMAILCDWNGKRCTAESYQIDNIPCSISMAVRRRAEAQAKQIDDK